MCLTLHYMLAIAVNKTDKNLCPQESYILVEKRKTNYNRKNVSDSDCVI